MDSSALGPGKEKEALTPVAERMRTLRDVLEACKQGLGRLEERLTPVTCEPTPSAPTPNRLEPQAGDCELVHQLGELVTAAAGLEDWMETLRERLQV